MRLRVAQRRVGAAPGGHRCERRGHAAGRARVQRQPGAPCVRDQAAGDRGVRADRPTSSCSCAACRCWHGRGAGVTGGLLLVRDVTEVRKRDKLLLSKDATIREIHHRVKNNLQTISSLLRLQGRRLNSEEAKAAVAESVRRIRTIALVHETLSREPGDDVAFLEIVRPLLRLAEEGLQSPDRPVRFTVQGEGGRLPSTIATPLSVVLTELLQNAVDHGFPEGSAGGDVVVVLDNADGVLQIRVDQRRPQPGARLRAQQGNRPRSVDRAHAGDHRARRHHHDAPGRTRRLRVGGSRRTATRHRHRRRPHRPRLTPSATAVSGSRRQVRADLTSRRSALARPAMRRREVAALLFRGAAPDAGVLVGLECVLQAVVCTGHSPHTSLARSICTSA